MNESERFALSTLIRENRTRLGLSARELARRAQIDNATITLLEQGKIAHPRAETLRGLAAAMDVPLADVYAAVNWLPEHSLPSLRPYMRAKYGSLTNDELAEVEAFVNRLSGHGRQGPKPGEDE